MTISTFLVVVLLDVGASSKPSVSPCPSVARFTSLPPAASPDSSANVGSNDKTLETEDAAGSDELNVATCGDEEISVDVGARASGKLSVSSATVAMFTSSVSSVAGVSVGPGGNEETEDVATGAEAV